RIAIGSMKNVRRCVVWWLRLRSRGGVDGVLGQASHPPLVELKQNYPNPFNPATTIPFTLSGDLFANGHRPKVSLKIYNVLAQLVAVPILQGTGQALDNLELSCSSPRSEERRVGKERVGGWEEKE